MEAGWHTLEESQTLPAGAVVRHLTKGKAQLVTLRVEPGPVPQRKSGRQVWKKEQGGELVGQRNKKRLAEEGVAETSKGRARDGTCEPHT